MIAPLERLLPLEGDRRARAVRLFLIAACFSAANVILGTIATTAFLADRGVDELPRFYLLLATASLPLAAWLGSTIDREPHSRLFQQVVLASAAVVLLLRLLIPLRLPATPYGLLLASHALDIAGAIAFWVLASDHLTTRDLKRATVGLAVGLAVGGAGSGECGPARRRAAARSDRDSARRQQLVGRLVAALSALHPGRVPAELPRALASRDLRTRANAIEAIVSLPERKRIAGALPLIETLVDEVPAAAGGGQDTIARARRSWDPWVRRAAAATDPSTPHEREEVDMELLLFLKRTRLFGPLPLDAILAITRVLATEARIAGETIFAQGGPGQHLYLVRSGAVEVRAGGRTVARLDVGSYLGEMALVDDEPRSATVIASEDSMLLRLDRATFHELTEDHPVILRELCRLLATNLREANARFALSNGSDSQAWESRQAFEPE